MGRLIDIDDLDITTITTDDYSGNEVLDIVLKEDVDNAPTVEAIPKADYEARLKADMVAMLTEIQLEIEEMKMQSLTEKEIWNNAIGVCSDLIQQKINSLKESEDEVN